MVSQACKTGYCPTEEVTLLSSCCCLVNVDGMIKFQAFAPSVLLASVAICYELFVLVILIPRLHELLDSLRVATSFEKLLSINSRIAFTSKRAIC